MHFYTRQHQSCCGIDLHARSMYVCIIDQAGTIVFHSNLPTDRRHLLQAINACRADVVVAVACIFTWY